MNNKKRSAMQVGFIVVFALLCIFVLRNTSDIIKGISLCFCAVLPFFFGLCIAFAVNIIMVRFEKMLSKLKMLRKKQIRGLSLALSFSVIIMGFSAMMFVILPKVSDAFYVLSKNLPEYSERLLNAVKAFCDNYMPKFVGSDFVGRIITNEPSDYFSVGEKLLSATASLADFTVSTVVAVVFSVYVLAGKEELYLGSEKLIKAIFPEKVYSAFFKITRLSGQIFSAFLSGQFTEGCIIGVLCYIGMKIFGFPYAAVSSVVVGFTALIPIFGALFGTVLDALLIFTVSPKSALWFVVFVLALQQIEGNLIYPRVVGRSVGLPGIWVLAATVVGGKLFGIGGMFFSVPICSVLYILLKEFVDKKSLKTY